MTLPTSIDLALPVTGHATHGQYALVEACLAEGMEIPAHVGTREDVVLHVLHGELAVSVDRAAQTVTGGGSVTLPRGVPRRITALRPTRVLSLIAPAGLEQLLAVVADPATDPDDRAALLAVGGVQTVPCA
jgi:quercetin dioxygenase-like cupin family protein